MRKAKKCLLLRLSTCSLITSSCRYSGPAGGCDSVEAATFTLFDTRLSSSLSLVARVLAESCRQIGVGFLECLVALLHGFSICARCSGVT
jgi:hypothetical protein